MDKYRVRQGAGTRIGTETRNVPLNANCYSLISFNLIFLIHRSCAMWPETWPEGSFLVSVPILVPAPCLTLYLSITNQIYMYNIEGVRGVVFYSPNPGFISCFCPILVPAPILTLLKCITNQIYMHNMEGVGGSSCFLSPQIH